MKLHKKITFGLLALTLVGPMTSCSDFLDEELTTQQNTDFFDTQEGIDRLEVSLYYNLRFHFAKEWACAKQKNGYANIYDLDMTGLKVLHLNAPEYNILNWLAILADNRTYWQNGSIAEQAKNYIKENFLPDISEYDVIVGYRADDSYFSFAQDFVAGVISLQKLSEAMRFGKLGEQIVLKSQNAFEQITFVGYEDVDAVKYYVKKRAREQEARKEYRARKQDQANVNDLYILDIMREEIKDGDARLFV